jgi:hypothetical protein
MSLKVGLPKLSQGSLLASFLFGLLKNSLSLDFLKLDGQHYAYRKEEKDDEVTAGPEYEENRSHAQLIWLYFNEVLQEQNDGPDDCNGDPYDKQESEHRHPLLLIRKECQGLLAVVLADEEETDEFQGLQENEGHHEPVLLQNKVMKYDIY